MQISPIKNSNFEKPSTNLSKRTKVKILKNKFLGYLSKKIWFRVCSVTAEMFEHRNSGENQRKLSEIFFENLPRAYKDLIQVKKKFKIISCLCTFKVYCTVRKDAINKQYLCLYRGKLHQPKPVNIVHAENLQMRFFCRNPSTCVEICYSSNIFCSLKRANIQQTEGFVYVLYKESILSVFS